MPNLSVELGVILKKLRGRRSTYEVSEKWGISQSAVSDYENGVKIPRREVFDQILRLEGFKDYAEFFSYGKPAAEVSDRQGADLLRVLDAFGVSDPDLLRDILDLVSRVGKLYEGGGVK